MGPGRARGAAGAGFGLGCALLGLALPDAGGRPLPCADPAALPGGAGGSPRVACQGRARGLPDLEGPVRRVFGLPVDPNRADVLTLETLPGIGSARARAIVRERERRPFASVSDLARVSGVGPRTLERLAPALAVARRADEE